jgi:hypothetical protein
MKRKALVVLLCMVFIGNAFSLDVGFLSVREIKAYCERILTHMRNGEIESAFELIKSQWLFPKEEIDSVHEKTVSQLDNLENRFGRPLDVTAIGEEHIGEIVIRLTYVIKHERHLIRWVFMFYKPKNKWILNSFKWDDKIDELF